MPVVGEEKFAVAESGRSVGCCDGRIRRAFVALITLTPLLTRGLLPQLIQIVDLQSHRTSASAFDAVEHAHYISIRN